MAQKHLLPDLSKLSDVEKDELIVSLHARVEELESGQVTIRKDSHNSSIPPSADGLKKLKKTRSLRKQSDKKVGGQAGHIGTTLKQREQPTQTVVHSLPAQCDQCQMPLPKDGARVSARRQVIDIPVIPCEIIEHQTLEQVCRCGKVHVSAFPSAVTESVQYGPNVKALGVHLTHGQLLPYARAAQLIGDLYGIAPSPGTLLAWVGEASAALKKSADVIARHLHAAPVVHADETGLRVDSKLYWMHVAATEKLTWYGVHAKRGMEAIIAHGILPNRTGVLVHDCWKPYWSLDCVHALCNAHLLRELVYVKELTGQVWPEQMMGFLCQANDLCEAARQKNIPLSTTDTAAFVTVYQKILSEGERLNPAAVKPTGKRGRCKQSVAFNLLGRMRQYSDAVLLFIHDPSIPFTNNNGEYGVRMPKVKQKISGCFRTVEGAQHFCVIRSCLATLHKQGHSMLEAMRRAFAGNPITPATC
jgi:transposase